jgi:hypothetical protein
MKSKTKITNKYSLPDWMVKKIYKLILKDNAKRLVVTATIYGADLCDSKSIPKDVFYHQSLQNFIDKAL